MAINHNSVWENTFRKPGVQRGLDCCGAKIDKAAYGDANSKYGWEVDHIVPDAKDGGNKLSNLRPLHWKNNDAKADNLDGQWICAVGSRKGRPCLPNSERPDYEQ